MAVSRKDVLEIAALARLRLEDAEVERLTLQLNDILAHVEELAEVAEDADADGDADAGWRVDWASPQREDAEGADPLGTPIEAFAPDFREGFFVVPRLGAMGGGGAAADADSDAEPGGGGGGR